MGKLNRRKSAACHRRQQVAEEYFTLLEDLLLAVRLPVFTSPARRRLTRHPKFFFFDTGVFRTIRPGGPLDNPEEIGGLALGPWSSRSCGQ